MQIGTTIETGTKAYPFALRADNLEMAVVIALYLRRRLSHSDQDVMVNGVVVYHCQPIVGPPLDRLKGFIDGLRWAVCGCK